MGGLAAILSVPMPGSKIRKCTLQSVLCFVESTQLTLQKKTWATSVSIIWMNMLHYHGNPASLDRTFQNNMTMIALQYLAAIVSVPVSLPVNCQSKSFQGHSIHSYFYGCDEVWETKQVSCSPAARSVYLVLEIRSLKLMQENSLK
jgi:hypothetical protein